METCENCKRQIGNLETPRLFNGAVVCPECESRLTRQSTAPAPFIAPQNQHNSADAKRWMNYGIALSIIGTAIAVASHRLENGPATGAGVIGVCLGLLMFSVGRIKGPK